MMARKTPDQDLFDALFKVSRDLDYLTYPHKPPRTAKYPMVHIGDVQLIPIATKSYLLATLHAQLDVWGDETQRRDVSDMAHALMERISRIKELSGGYRISMNYEASSVQVMTDNSTDDNLWRANVSLEFSLW